LGTSEHLFHRFCNFCNMYSSLSKRRRKLQRGVLLMHDIAPAHTYDVETSVAAEQTITPSTVFARCNTLWLLFVDLFPLPKEHLHGTQFSSGSSITEFVEDISTGARRIFYKTRIQKLWKWQNKCLEVCKDYVEKLNGHCCCIVFLYMWGWKFLGQLSYTKWSRRSARNLMSLLEWDDLCIKMHYPPNTICFVLPSVLWCCWLGGSKGIQPLKIWVLRCLQGYLSRAKGKWLAYVPADATATPSSLLQ